MTLYKDAPTGLAYLEGDMKAEQRWVVPVEPCEHGKIDPHPVVPVGGSWYQCPGAGIGETL